MKPLALQLLGGVRRKEEEKGRGREEGREGGKEGRGKEKEKT